MPGTLEAVGHTRTYLESVRYAACESGTPPVAT